MAGATVAIDIKDDEIRRLFARLVNRVRSPEPALREIGEIVTESVLRNFEEHRSPEGKPWKPLSKRYREWKEKKKGRSAADILILDRILMGSIHPQIEPTRVLIGTNMVYAAIHQFGGETGRNHAAVMPARPFLGVRNEDWSEIREVLERHIMETE